MYKIAIAGASTLLGKELKDALSDSTLAAASFVLLDEDEGWASWIRWATRSPSSSPSARMRSIMLTLLFSADTEELTRRHWRQALRAGSTVLDLSGALDQEPGVLVRAPWIGTEAASADLFTPAVVPAHLQRWPSHC